MLLRTLKGIFFLLIVIFLVGCSFNESTTINDTETENINQESQEEVEETGETEKSSGTGKRIIIAIPAAPPNLDSHTSTAQVIADVGRHIFDTLVTIDSNFNVKPMLAESWEQSEDGKTLTFYLRQGVLFHNGKELTAEDVIASLDRWFRLSSLGKADFAGARLEAKDDYTVVIELPEPVSTALSTLAYGGGNFGSIMPKEIIENAPDEGVEEYIGTGPFKFADWKQDQYILLTKFEDYQPLEEPTDGLSGKKEALVDELQFMLVPDASTRVAGIQTGEYDVILDVQYDMYELLSDNKDLQIYTDPYGELNIFYNKVRGLFTDINARNAVAKAIDKESILMGAVANEDFYILDHSLMMNFQSALWSSDAGKDEYFQENNSEEAKKLLEQAGYNGEEIRIITSKDQAYLYNASVVLNEQLNQIGLNTNIEVYDWPTYLDKRSDPEAFELLIGASTPKLDPTSMAFLRDNFVGWTKDDKLNEIIKEFKSAPTIEEAKVIYHDLQEWFYEYKPVTKIGDFYKINAARNTISGYNYLDGPMFWNVTKNE